MQHKLTEVTGEIDKSIIILKNFNTPIICRTTRQKIIKHLQQLNKPVHLISIYRKPHPTTEYTLLSDTKTDHILDHKPNLNKFLKIEIIQKVFSGNNGIKPEISGKE